MLVIPDVVVVIEPLVGARGGLPRFRSPSMTDVDVDDVILAVTTSVTESARDRGGGDDKVDGVVVAMEIVDRGGVVAIPALFDFFPPAFDRACDDGMTLLSFVVSI